MTESQTGKRPQISAGYVQDTPGEPDWQKAEAYEMAYSLDRTGAPDEGGRVRFAWNERGLYVQAELEDSFLIAKDRRDEQMHFETGDVFELFVKPLDDSYYWEMYATPFGSKSTFFFPRERGDMTDEECLRWHDFRGLEISVEKSSNGWNARMFVPVDQLIALGETWEAGARWTVFCGRYNYSSDDLKNPELSMTPPLSKTDYHLTDEYAVLQLNG